MEPIRRTNWLDRRAGMIWPCLLLAHATLLLINTRLQSPTRNEVAHVPAGLACWRNGSFNLYSVNPPFAKMVATLPTLRLVPDLGCTEEDKTIGLRAEWGVARCFADANAARYFDLVWSARLAGIGWSVLGGYVIYLWASDLYGRQAGLLSLVLWCSEPYVLAHGPLATPDVPAAVAGVAATYIFWRGLRSGSWETALLAGLLLGIAQLTKFTAIVLYPVWTVLAVVHALAPAGAMFQPPSHSRRVLQLTATFLASVAIVNVGYLFEGTGQALGDYHFFSQALSHPRPVNNGLPGGDEPGNRFAGTGVGRVPVPLPADYLLGIDLQKRDFESHWLSYLRGEWRDRGWWYYYLYALAVKIPLGAWGLALWGFVLTVMRHRASVNIADELTLWLPASAVIALVSSQTGFNHHSRYILPALPFIAVATGKVAYFLDRERWRAGIVAATLLVCSVASSLSVYPHSLSYFNELVGGPDRGHEHLVDSNIDWGQDLFFFKRWADRHPEASPIGLAYFNFIDYRVVLKADYPEVPPDPGVGGASVGPHPGWWAVDVYSLKAGSHKYFERFRPVAKAGYSIFIYHLTPEEVTPARRDMGLPPLPVPGPAR
jgi:hypothetical protein